MTNEDKKQCTVCGIPKHSHEFYTRKNSYQEPHCKKCRSAMVNQYNKKKRDKTIIIQQAMVNKQKRLVNKGNYFYWE